MRASSGDARSTQGRDATRLHAPARRVVHAVVTADPVDLTALEALVGDRSAGAVVSFGGIVRDHDGGRSVTELEYVGHPTAGQVIDELAQEFAARPEVRAVAVSHRVGLLGIGDVALACAVSTSHRAAAFGVCAELVDEVKARLPIWKRQVFTDGEEEWVACP